MTVELEPGLTRVTAPNPSPLTGDGTNSYIVGSPHMSGPVVIIDPGPDHDAHLDALVTAIGDKEVAAILVTHWHRDHSTLAPRLSRAVDAPIHAFGSGSDGRSKIMDRLAATGTIGGGEGMDPDFVPDTILRDGAVFEFGEEGITAIHTPGHFAGHLSFAWRDVVFSGDHVMGWSTTLISPPDGDLTAFMASCRRLAGRSDRAYYPGHGPDIPDPAARVAELMAHRKAREAQIIGALKEAPMTPAEVTERVYTDVPTHLWPAAERNVLAHLIALVQAEVAAVRGPLARDAKFHLI